MTALSNAMAQALDGCDATLHEFNRYERVAVDVPRMWPFRLFMKPRTAVRYRQADPMDEALLSDSKIAGPVPVTLGADNGLLAEFPGGFTIGEHGDVYMAVWRDDIPIMVTPVDVRPRWQVLRADDPFEVRVTLDIGFP